MAVHVRWVGTTPANTPGNESAPLAEKTMGQIRERVQYNPFHAPRKPRFRDFDMALAWLLSQEVSR